MTRHGLISDPEHISQPDRIAWKSMCATSEGREKGEKWCKRAIWRNTLPAIKQAWKSVDKLTSEAFVGMWRARVAEFYSKYTATATVGHPAVSGRTGRVFWLAGPVFGVEGRSVGRPAVLARKLWRRAVFR